MIRAKAPRGRARLPITTPRLVPTLLLGLALSMSGCGGGQTAKAKAPSGPSKEATACRTEWKGLEQKVGDHPASTPSALAPRWNTIAATIDYYATSASPTDCDKTLSRQESAINALTAFSKRLGRYDMQLRLEHVKTQAESYAAGPRPPAPKPSKKKGKKGKGRAKAAPRPPRPADVAAALKTLTTQAPRAARQQGPGWQQARVTELSDRSAVKKTIKDLSFLSRESKAYRACAAALAKIEKAVRAKRS